MLPVEALAPRSGEPRVGARGAGEALAAHLNRPLARGHVPADAFTGAAGGAACGDLIRISLSVCARDPRGLIDDAGFDARGCGAAVAAGSAAVSLLRGSTLLEAARLGPEDIADALGGLSAAKRHAAELAADALHRALGAAARRIRLAHDRRRTLVAMSGGVDSAVAALMLTRAGEEVVAVTLELWSDPENDGERSCCSAHAVRAARALAHELGMPHLSIDLRAEFRAGVVEPWLTDHAGGLTPNPCLRCNGSVRLDAMLELASRLGADALATGHYARLAEGPQGPLLRVAADARKDQSYALAGVAPASLARLRFPLSELSKDEVRGIAARAGLPVADKPDSQDLCFLAGTGRDRFIARHGAGAPQPGPIIDLEGRRLGAHAGHQRFTVGQRHGLGLGGRGPHFVLGTDPDANTVTVGPRTALRARAFELEDVTLYRCGAMVDAVKVRSRGARLACAVPGEPAPGRHRRLAVALAEPAERTAPGQLACLYVDDVIVGYGTVAREHRATAGA
jgi:tRNA-specific 2-thiouridylase